MLFVPNVIERVAVPVPANIPVVRSKPPRLSVPLVSVVVPVATVASASPSVVVPDVLLIVNAAMVRPLLVMVPVPSMVGVKLENVPAE